MKTLLISSLILLNIFAQTEVQSYLYEEIKLANVVNNTNFPKLIRGKTLKCNYKSMLDETYHNYDVTLLFKSDKIIHKGNKSISHIPNNIEVINGEIKSFYHDRSFLDFIFGEEVAEIEYNFFEKNGFLYITKSSSKENSRERFKTNGKTLIEAYKCNIKNNQALVHHSNIDNSSRGVGTKEEPSNGDNKDLKSSGSSVINN